MSAPPPAEDPREQLADRLAARMWRAWATATLAVALVGVHVQVGVFRASRGAVDAGTALLGARGARLLTRVGGMKTSRVDEGELWRLVSAVFLHTNLLHLTLNVMGLLLVGRLVEAMLGATRMFTVFLWSGVTGAAASWLLAATPVSVGASGGIFGLLGAALVFVLRHGDELPDDVRRHLRKHLLISILFNLPVGLVVPVIDQAAHVGGLVGGAVLGALLGDRVTEASRARAPATAALALGCAAALAWAAWGLRRTI
jgi:membrane associated rhomboid family serine protease